MNYPQITQINADYKNVFYFNLRNLRNLRINLFVGISNDIGDTSLKPVELGAAAALADGRYRQKPNRPHRHTPMNALSL
jgi:hypothetical protein